MSTLPAPLREGVVTSLARPGGNITGLTLDAEELAGRQAARAAEGGSADALPRCRTSELKRAVRCRAEADRGGGPHAQARSERISCEGCLGSRPHACRAAP